MQIILLPRFTQPKSDLPAGANQAKMTALTSK